MSFDIPEEILNLNPRVVPIPTGRKAPSLPGWPETRVRARDLDPGRQQGCSGYGIVLDSNWLVIDVDMHGDVDGTKTLEKLSSDIGVDLKGEADLVTESPSGGFHLYYLKEPTDKFPKSVKEFPGLDFLTKGSQVIGPGSSHVSGGKYKIRKCSGPLGHIADGLLGRLMREREPLPAIQCSRPQDSPLDDFNTTRDGVEDVKSLLTGAGYRVLAKGDGTYEFIRPGKRESSHMISGTLGRRSKTGRFILRNFSTSDPTGFPSEHSVTIAEAYRMLKGIDLSRLPIELSDEGYGNMSSLTDEAAAKMVADLKSETAGEELLSSCPTYTLGGLAKEAPSRRPYVIEQLLRKGETLNFVAAPKSGKSWGVYNLALQISQGGEFMGFRCPDKTKCLIVDAELHKEELHWRVKTASEATGIDPGDNLHLLPLRGSVVDVYKLEELLVAAGAGHFGLIVLDALYRFLPDGVSENDNAQMMLVYNCLDRIARIFDAAVVVVHHTSKGFQGGKAVTDLGSGAGSITRAADSQLVILPHEEDGLFCFEAFTRSSKTPPPRVGRLVDGEWVKVDTEPIRKSEPGKEAKDSRALAAQLKREARAKKVGEYLSENKILFVDNAEKIFGKGTTAGQYRGFMTHLEKAGVIIKGDFGKNHPTEDWEAKLGRWIEEGCPTEGEKRRSPL